MTQPFELVFFFGGTPLGTPPAFASFISLRGTLESLMGVPNGVPNKFGVESPKKKVESLIIFKIFLGEFLVCFMKMVLDVVFGFS